VAYVEESVVKVWEVNFCDLLTCLREKQHQHLKQNKKEAVIAIVLLKKAAIIFPCLSPQAS